MVNSTTFYLCKGNNPTCSFVGCAVNGGECKFTINPEYAINGECADPEKHPERFEPERFTLGSTSSKTVIYYWEKETKENAQDEA